jgi:hypothetical protein
MKHPGHTYGGFVPAISERGMTIGQITIDSWPHACRPDVADELLAQV